MDKEIIVGLILKPQGIKGEIKYKPLLAEDKIQNFSNCTIAGKNFEVENNAIRFGYGYLKLIGINSRNDAENFRNKKIIIAEKQLGAFDDDEFLISEIIGSKIFSEDGDVIGTLKDVEQYGAADVFVISTRYGVKNVPYLKKIFVKIDTQSKTIIVNKNEYDILAI